MKILVIDDHPLVLDALKALLPQWGDGVEVLAAGDAAKATRLLDDEPDDRADAARPRLPGTRGLDFLADLMLDYPGVPVLVLSATHDRATVAAALAAGARGFMSKTASARGAARSDAAVAEGFVYRAADDADCPRRRRRAHRRDRLGLTRRQSDVLRLLVAGQAQQAHLPRPPACPRARSRSTSARSSRRCVCASRAQAVAELARRGHQRRHSSGGPRPTP